MSAAEDAERGPGAGARPAAPAASGPMFRERVILHVDMDAFFVGVELLSRPELRGRQVVVAGDGPRSVVLSASYEARALGVGSAMPADRARQLAPRAVWIPPSKGLYQQYSQQIMEVLRSVTDRVEQVSVDEAFMDVTGARRRLGGPVGIARWIRAEITRRTGLVASVGVAGTKFVAKMASTGSKPDGLWVIPDDRVLEFLDPLPVRKLWGVGEKTAEALTGAGLHTSGQVREVSLEFLQRRLGRASGAHLHQLVRGVDPRPVVTERIEKSMGAEHTFDYDTDDIREIKAVLLQLSHQVARRLRRADRHAWSVAVKLRDERFRTVSRARALDRGISTGREVYAVAWDLVEQLGPLASRVRLVGVRAEKLDADRSGEQMILWEPAEGGTVREAAEWGQAESAMDRIQERFGPAGLAPARLLGSARRPGSERGPGPGENTAEKDYS